MCSRHCPTHSKVASFPSIPPKLILRSHQQSLHHQIQWVVVVPIYLNVKLYSADLATPSISGTSPSSTFSCSYCFVVFVCFWFCFVFFFFQSHELLLLHFTSGLSASILPLTVGVLQLSPGVSSVFIRHL